MVVCVDNQSGMRIIGNKSTQTGKREMKELRKNIKTLAREEAKTELEIVTLLQTGAAATDNEELLEMLCEIKWELIAA